MTTISRPDRVDASKMKLDTAPTAEEDDLDSEMGLMSLADSPHLDANVSLVQSLAQKGGKEACKEVYKGPKFTRSWSFVESGEDRKVKLAERKSNLRLEVVKRALNKAWSFTDTLRSPNPEEPNSNYLDFVHIDHKATKHSSKPGTPHGIPMASITEAEESTVETQPLPVDEKVEEEEGIEEDEVEQEIEEPNTPEPDYKVKPRVKTVVLPAEPQEIHWLPLSNLDRVVNPTFSSVIHYYKDVVTETRSFSDVTKHLKQSLAETLVHFYPLAGRLALKEDGRVDLHCNNEGAVWIEAEIDKTLEDIGGAKPNHRLSGFDAARLGAGPIYIPDQITPMPVLVVQVTNFTDGSIAIATSWHHTVADGFSGTHFLRSWAEVAQGKPIAVKPVHTRELLNPRENLNPTLVNGYTSQSMNGIPDEVKASTAKPAKLGTFGLSKEKIAELKKKANLEPPPFTPRPFTSAESISAHLWRQMTKARATANRYGADKATAQPTKFFMFVDGRKRLRLPAGYFGNVVCSACAEAKEADILNRPLHYAACLIRIATRNITEEYFRSLIDWVELQGMSSTKSEHVNSLGHDVAATFWTFFPLYDIEFGWGRPIFAARNSPPRPHIDGIAMMPSKEGQGMVALLNLHSDRMSKLQRQISFATVFH
ncbi:unnamed protein product [Calypogeia fissa]